MTEPGEHLLESEPAGRDPLPQRYLTDEPGVGGQIKQRPEDFLVDEQPLYDLEGAGEHLYLGVEATNVSHLELMSCLRRHFGVKESAIGYAGMKDKVGVTRQMVSLHLPQDPPAVVLPHERIRVLWTDRHRHKLRRGHLRGNRFSIRIREVDPLKAPSVGRILRKLEETGVPTYFGAQRFGYRRNNHIVGLHLLRQDWKALIDEVLGTGGTPYPAYQQERRVQFDAGEYERALTPWTTADRAERMILRALCRGASPKEACYATGRTTWSFWISAVQSAIFNRVLDERIALGTFGTCLPGDRAWKHDRRRTFRVTDEELESGELAARASRFEISPSGPLWGRKMDRAEGKIDELERAAAEQFGIGPELLQEGRDAPEGGRRPLRETIRDPEVDSGIDEHGGYIRVAFDLPRGIYATIVLRELMKNDGAET